MLLDECNKLKERKYKLERDISKLLTDFTFETGIEVSHFKCFKETRSLFSCESMVTDRWVKVILDTEDM